jgi:hypothetical protein
VSEDPAGQPIIALASPLVGNASRAATPSKNPHDAPALMSSMSASDHPLL